MKALLLSLLLFASAVQATDDLAAREAHLAAQLRCVVCQNQTIAESNAPLAADMRREIRTQLENGRSDQQIVDFFEERYGVFVHYKPPFKASTWLLWLAPLLIVLAGLITLLTVLRKRSRSNAVLSEEDRQRARRLLEEDDVP